MGLKNGTKQKVPHFSIPGSLETFGEAKSSGYSGARLVSNGKRPTIKVTRATSRVPDHSLEFIAGPSEQTEKKSPGERRWKCRYRNVRGCSVCLSDVIARQKPKGHILILPGERASSFEFTTTAEEEKGRVDNGLALVVAPPPAPLPPSPLVSELKHRCSSRDDCCVAPKRSGCFQDKDFGRYQGWPRRRWMTPIHGIKGSGGSSALQKA
ncbi:UNVERIFIED_CONTAM: hypothetical protein K2H54_047992 [Gekko kuhli]